jgi:two-component system response regulator DevR
MNILLVEDSPLVREQLLLLVQGINGITHISQAESPGQALAVLKKLPIHIMILDIVLQGGTGIEVLEKMKKKGNKPPLVIVLTNYPNDQLRDKCLATGADYFLDKSVDFNKIPTLLQEWQESNKGN